MKVYRTLMIICCVISALIVAALVFVFIYAGMLWGLVSLGGELVFVCLMMLFKKLDQAEQLKRNPPPPTGDFITGKAKKDENNQDK